MKNYAGHRLSPWLGHLMVSRQETARPLLTAGEIMQLPPSDELVLLSGCPPIRAKKMRYFQDRHLKARITPPPDPTPRQDGDNAPPSPPSSDGGPWTEVIPPTPKAVQGDPANAGVRREPELPDHEDIVAKPPDQAPEFEFPDERDDDIPAQDFEEQARLAARQAPLDPRDDLGM